MTGSSRSAPTSASTTRWVIQTQSTRALLITQGGNLEKELRAAVPDYADVYFDNVGGETLDIMLSLTKRYGKVACCGAISRMSNDADNG